MNSYHLCVCLSLSLAGIGDEIAVRMVFFDNSKFETQPGSVSHLH